MKTKKNCESDYTAEMNKGVMYSNFIHISILNGLSNLATTNI